MTMQSDQTAKTQSNHIGLLARKVTDEQLRW